MEKDRNLLEWYENGVDDEGNVQGAVVIKSIEEPPISQCDLGDVPIDSPQGDIQKEIIKKEMGAQLSTQNDQVIAQDKIKIYKATGLIKVIEARLARLAALTTPYTDDAIKKEDLASDIKKLANELTEIVGSL
ncbi:MAG TPA: hypothetical protein VMZ91_01935 [Candidatus Paceibacterota bacterium]|nr:hypothetical protein [Candidatus Paceibacterota bacterium]